MKQTLTLLTVAFLLSVSAFAKPPVKKMKSTSVQHIVLFKFKADATPEKIKEIIAAFEALPSKISQIKDLKWGTNNSPENHAHGLTHAFILTFDSEKDRDAYLPHPAHAEFGKIVGPWIDEINCCGFHESGRPTLGEVKNASFAVPTTDKKNRPKVGFFVKKLVHRPRSW